MPLLAVGKNGSADAWYYSQGHKWDIMVDLFFYREPEETKRQEEEVVAVAVADYTLPPADYGLSTEWGNQIADGQWTADVAPPPIATVPATTYYLEQGEKYNPQWAAFIQSCMSTGCALKTLLEQCSYYLLRAVNKSNYSRIIRVLVQKNTHLRLLDNINKPNLNSNLSSKIFSSSSSKIFSSFSSKTFSSSRFGSLARDHVRAYIFI